MRCGGRPCPSGAVVLPALAGAIAAAFAYGLAVLWRTEVVERDRRTLARAFRLYLPAPAIDRLLQGPRGPELGGEIRERDRAVFRYCELYGVSEKRDPQAVVTALNVYFDQMAEIIEREDGFIDKFIGDAIVAVFGAPVERPDHAAAAVRTALAMAINTAVRFRTRVGIHSGPALIGNIGASRRFNYTVVGDTVNLASRIEGANKEYSSSILVSEDTCIAAHGIAFREVDRVRVVGRTEPVTLFTPLPDGTDVSREALYAAALALYREGHFCAAVDGFAKLDSDPIAAAMGARARSLATSHPASWDGVTKLATK